MVIDRLKELALFGIGIVNYFRARLVTRKLPLPNRDAPSTIWRSIYYRQPFRHIGASEAAQFLDSVVTF